MTAAEPSAPDRSVPAVAAAERAHPPRRHRRVPSWAGWAVAFCTFAAVGPMLPRFELSNGIEQLYAATVLEMNRGGPWLVPTLYGRPRIAKPPLPAWAGASAVTPDTMAGVASPDPAARSAAFLRLAGQVRWPALLAGCLMLAATFDLGRSVGGRRVGLAAATVAATSFLFLRYARLATGDVYLGLFVAAANALAARALLRRQRWVGVVGAGAALGLAVMCKGPVGLVQTVLPLAVWGGVVGWMRRGTGEGRTGSEGEGDLGPESPAAPPRVRSGAGPSAPTGAGAERGTRWVGPALVAFAAFLLIALPWPVLVLRSLNGAWNLWRREVTREGATDHEYGPVWSYLSLLPNLLPWLPMFLLGVGLTFRRGRARTLVPVADAAPPPADPRGDGALDYQPAETSPPGRVPRSANPVVAALRRAVGRSTAHRGYLLALLLLVVPLIVMSCVRDKSERYLLPVLPAAAVLAGRGTLAVLAGVRRGRPVAVGALALQLGLVAAMLVGLPAAGMTQVLVRVDGHPWFGQPLGLAALAAGVVLAVAMFAVARRGRPGVALGLAAAGMLAANALLLWGYKDDPAGRAEMRPIADRILARHADPAVAYVDPQKPLPPDLPIYLNRVVPNVKPAVATAAATRPADAWPNGRMPDVIVMLQRENAPEPTLPGWRSFAKEPYKKRFWHALERDAARP